MRHRLSLTFILLTTLPTCATAPSVAPPATPPAPDTSPPPATPPAAAPTPPVTAPGESAPVPDPAAAAAAARESSDDHPRLAWVNPARCLTFCGSAPAVPLATVDDAGLADEGGAHQVAATAREDLAALIAAGRAAGHQLKINSAHRSHQQQTQLFRSFKKAGWVARPGHSEHELGTAVDVAVPTPASAIWLAAQAPGFGFTLSYPKGKVRETGYRPEPWHLRHVGKPLAEEIARQGITLEELFRARPELGESGACEDCPTPISRAPCGKITPTGTCRGPILTWCFDGALARVDCAAFGQRCARDPDSKIPDCR